jgi:hypothetical protein
MILKAKIQTIGFILFLSSGASALANFTGHWIATNGKVSSTVGLSSKCSKVEIDIVQTEDAIQTKIYNATCDSFGSKWGPITQTIKNGKVYEQDEEVGKINEDTMITISTSGSYQYAYNLKLIKGADGKTQLMSYYGVKGAVGAMVTEATHDLQRHSLNR